MMRLDKFLALQGLGTRSEVRALLRAGRVCVQGVPAKDGALSVDAEKDAVTFDGETLVHEETLHVMLNKPTGVITAADDPRHETVMDILPRRFAAMGCMPVGRLDKDAEGLLLLTTDGALAHRLLSPKRHVDKVYYVQVDGPLGGDDVTAFAAGLVLSDFTAQPALLEILPDATSAYVTIHEGKFHQVKRMFHVRGRTVTRLKRMAFGGLALDERLSPGAWRKLTEDEYRQLCLAAGGKEDA